MTRDLKSRPVIENSPVSMPKAAQAARVITKSEAIRALPIFRLVYFFKIMATISVPPLEASMLNSSAEPKAGRRMAKKSSSIGSLVKGLSMGKSHSSPWVNTDMSTVE